LSDENVTQIGIFDIPQFVECDDELRIVEIAIVSPPYLLDFGKAYVDRPSPYTAEQLDENLSLCRELFERNDWDMVEQAISALSTIGIIYLDIKPANICIR
jgi:hypothetical protein